MGYLIILIKDLMAIVNLSPYMSPVIGTKFKRMATMSKLIIL